MRYKKIILSALTFLMSVIAAYGQAIITDSSDNVPLGKHLFLLASDDSLSINEVLSSSRFSRLQEDVPNLGLSSAGKSVWLKFEIINLSKDPHLLLDIAYPLLDQVEVFIPEKGKIMHKTLGQNSDFGKRKYKHPHYIFDIDVPVHRKQIVFMRVKSAEPVVLPITIGRPKYLWESLFQKNLFIGVFIGICLIMVAYNLFIFFSIKDVSYLYYVLYVLFLGLTQVGMKGYLFQYLWPGFPEIEVLNVVISACLCGITSLLFAASFLRVKEYSAKLFLASRILIALFSVAIFAALAGYLNLSFRLMHIATILLALVVLAQALLSVKKGYGPAKYFLSGWIIFFMGMMIFILKDFGLLPYNVFTSYSVMGSSAIEMAFLSFGLANRIKLLVLEKNRFQDASLKTAFENERIVREQNILLEQMVKERTSALNEANQELTSTLNNLQIAQNQLLESEKLASLGFLSRGIAHEINNPINFVTSNVTPLSRDVKLLFEFIESLEEQNNSKASAAEKKAKIRELKDEIDFEYLRTEVDFLLKGMSDGAERAVKILNGLRIFSRSYENDLMKCNLNEGLDSTLLIVNNLLNKIQVLKEYDDLPPVECFQGKLNHVFLNIIINAVQAINTKFGNEHGGLITVQTKALNGLVCISIRDNGTGMDEDTQEKVFEPFFTTRESSGGAGLGMSIAFNTIQRHNGTIKIFSEPGEGTEFIVELPVVHSDGPH